MTITVNRSPHGPLSIRVQIDASLSLADALALRAELDRAISAVQSERQTVALVEDAATKALEARRWWEEYAMGRAAGNESEGE